MLGYSRSSRKAGARIVTGCRVTGIDVDRGQVKQVCTSLGAIRTDAMVCAAGAWSGQLAALAGVSLPVIPLRRQIIITGPIDGLDPALPVTIDFSTGLYFRPEGVGLLIGLSDPDETPGFKLSRSEQWLPRLAEAVDRRIPSVSDAGLAGGWAGLFEETPDHNGLIGKSAEVEGFFYASGFSGHGFMLAPAVGEVMRDLYLERTPDIDVTALDVARFDRSDIEPELVVF
jgi:sarcosine oxidase subunit beta